MDQRREPRFAVHQAVRVKLLGTESSWETAMVKNVSSHGLAIELALPIQPCTALEIAFEDACVQGEAVYCNGDSDGYLVGIELDEMLCGLSALGRKLQEFADPGNVRMARPTGSRPAD